LAVERLTGTEAKAARAFRPVRRVAMIVVHSNPLAEPGAGDAGGMTVYVRQIARALSNRGVGVDIYSRKDGSDLPDLYELFPGVRVLQIPAGDPDITKEDLPVHLPEFTANLLRRVERETPGYDLVHSHYWLSGKVASRLAQRLRVTFVHTFHTLGRAKNRSGRIAPEPESRLAGEARVIAEADAIVASTDDERCWLVDLYAAHPEKIHVIPPGVDHELFVPGDKAEARRVLGIDAERVLLFVGRLQPLKAAGTAIRALGNLTDWGRLDPSKTKLFIVGGPSGSSGDSELAELRRLTEELGIERSVEFVPAQPHAELPRFYQAADVCLVPSLIETFGLVALEAQSCGIPVVASAVGGLKSVVRHGQTGFLVQPTSSEAFAERAWRILSDTRMHSSLSSLSVCSSRDFSWDRSANELSDLYSSALNIGRE
jgi:D-inositol-3-phosphate glycosyltransferase